MSKLLILVFLLSNLIQAQEVKVPNTKTDKYIVGFACYFSAKTTDVVKKFKILLQDKKYEKIASLLNSNESAEQYLSLKIIEKLNEIGEYEISNNDSVLISKIYKSEELVSVCSGCIYFDEVSLVSLLTQNDFTKFDIETKYWLDEIFKMVYKNKKSLLNK